MGRCYARGAPLFAGCSLKLSRYRSRNQADDTPPATNLQPRLIGSPLTAEHHDELERQDRAVGSHPK